MRSRLLARALVGLTAAVGLAVGGLAGAGTGFAASAPVFEPVSEQQVAVPAPAVARLAVENLGLSATQARNVQCWLRKYWGYTGALDGQLGTSSWQAYQRGLQHDWGYTGAIDGVVGSGTVMALQRQMRDAGWGYTGAIDGVAGPDTRAAFQRFADACLSVCREGLSA
ncbi:peptidoglycan-binding domain-containing protein [Streptomyces huiliensis]|uniref:peptidoglycan-binding domain-containing protein n=1 Tax=Streptomyces huiliensis TaxID=2876027 RepID=UPI001CBDFC8C|nr:peptidoglycan-binding protein [Streptomyces huiliensis]MBZ4323934.1 peptidoglycan-binding protein [Streptomyces huiliensis]